ncbi:MAG: hypothetical protein EKK62_03120 [Acidimicrobiia bacterium]|nr:MAG: hypothetical protein EKK62_03120 [Acidimicrobiia bacterium]
MSEVLPCILAFVVGMLIPSPGMLLYRWYERRRAVREAEIEKIKADTEMARKGIEELRAMRGRLRGEK